MVEKASSSRRRNASPSHSHSNPNVIIPSSCLSVKSVLLHNWWLVKNHAKQITVAGLASRERLGAREFVSAPISRRIDTTTLETLDGIIITINGFISRSRTLQNGFPISVCNDFELGFPFDWEDCVTQCTDEEYAKRRASAEKSDFDELKFSFENIPATRINGLVLHMSEESFQRFFRDDIMGKESSKAFQHSQEAAKSEVVKTPRSCKRVKTFQMHATIEQSRGVEYQTKRSKSSKNLESKEELNFSVNSKVLRNKSAKELSTDSGTHLSTPEAKKNSSKEVVCGLKDSSKKDKELIEACEESSVRRSGRLKIQKSYVGMAG